MQETLRVVPASRLAAHMHDTYGQVCFMMLRVENIDLLFLCTSCKCVHHASAYIISLKFHGNGCVIDDALSLYFVVKHTIK